MCSEGGWGCTSSGGSLRRSRSREGVRRRAEAGRAAAEAEPLGEAVEGRHRRPRAGSTRCRRAAEASSSPSATAQPSFWPQDAINAAADDARGKLALALSSHVEVLGIDIGDGGREPRGDHQQGSDGRGAAELARRGDLDGRERGAQRARRGVGARVAGEGPWRAAASRDGGRAEERTRVARSPSRVGGRKYTRPDIGADVPSPRTRAVCEEDAIANLTASLRAHVQAYTLLGGERVGADGGSVRPDAGGPGRGVPGAGAEERQGGSDWVDREGTRPGDPPAARSGRWRASTCSPRRAR